jgi:hypothetical protein
MTSAWSLFPHMVVRTTGFVWDLQDRLRQPATLRAARRLAPAEASLESVRGSAPRLRRPDRKTLALFRAGRPLDPARVPSPDWVRSWNKAVAARRAAEDELAQTFADEFRGARDYLHGIAADERFLDAVSSSSPAVRGDLVAGQWSARIERQVATYAQRFCAKNETMAFAGPINYGRLDFSAPAGVSLHWSGPEALIGRRGHVSAAVLRALISRVAFDPEVVPWLVLRRKAFQCDSITDGTTVGRIVDAADDRACLARLAARLSVPLAEAATAARTAIERGLLTHQLEVPAASLNPLLELVERVASLPPAARQRHLETLGEVMQLTRRFVTARADERVDAGKRVAMLADLGVAQRKGDKFYVDRLPLREECAGDLRLVVSGVRAHELRDRVTPLLDLLAADAVARRAALRDEIARILGPVEIPLWKGIARLRTLSVPAEPLLHELLRRALAGREDDEQICLDASELSVGGLLPCCDPIICSIDLMIGAPDVDAWTVGDYELIVGDIHDTALLTRWALQFHERADEVAADLSLAIGRLGNSIPLVSALAARRTGLPVQELPGVVAEIGGVASRAGSWHVGIDDLVVESDGVDVRLVSRSAGTEVVLHNGELESAVHTAFALPRVRPIDLRLGQHTPRIVISGVVAQRRRWDPPRAAFDAVVTARGDTERMRAAVRLWDEIGLPERVFAKVGGERKPILIDLANAFLLRALAKLVAPEPEITLSELLPGPSMLWLRSEHGRHTCELRCVYLRARATA